MTVTERVQADGQWTITLSAATPKTVRDRIGLLDHVVVTGARLTDTALDTATVLAQARYCGVLRDRPGDEAEQGYRIGGPALSWWLKTVVTETAVSHTDGTFSTWVGSLLGLVDDRLTVGTVQTVSGMLTHSSHLETVKTALNYVADHFGAAWRVNADGTVDVGDDLFTSGEAVIVRGTSGREPNVAGLSADRLETGEDLEDYANRVVVVADEGETVAADETPSGDITFQTVLGNPARITRLVAAPNTDTDNVSTVAARELSNRNQTRRALTLSSDVYDIGRDVKAGDTVEVYDPDVGLVDTGRQLLYRGRTINPVALETYAVTWPVQDGMGVYLLTDDGVVDLSEWVVWEDGPSRLEVGAQSRRLTPTTRDAASEDVAKWDKFDTHMRDSIATRTPQPLVVARPNGSNVTSLTATIPEAERGRWAKLRVTCFIQGDDERRLRLRFDSDASSGSYDSEFSEATAGTWGDGHRDIDENFGLIGKGGTSFGLWTVDIFDTFTAFGGGLVQWHSSGYRRTGAGGNSQSAGGFWVPSGDPVVTQITVVGSNVGTTPNSDWIGASSYVVVEGVLPMAVLDDL